MSDNNQTSQKLRYPGQLSEEVLIPQPLALAIAAGRPELVKLMPVEAISAEAVKRLYHLIAVLIDTNQQLRAHVDRVETSCGEINRTLFHLRDALQMAGRQVNEAENILNGVRFGGGEDGS